MNSQADAPSAPKQRERERNPTGGRLSTVVPSAECERHPPTRATGFLPAAGNRNGSSVNNAGSNGNYWSSTHNGSNNAYNLNFNSGNVNPSNNNNRYNGRSVRLVRSAENSQRKKSVLFFL